MSKNIEYLECGLRELRAIVARNPGNAFINTQETLDRPLRYLFLHKGGFYQLAIDKQSLILGANMIERNDRAKQLTLHSTSVRSEYSHQGIGKNLVRMIFEKAAENEYALSLTEFTHDGREYLAKVFARTHMNFPSVRLTYENGRYNVTGQKEYELTFRKSDP